MKSLDFWREALCGCMAVATLASCALSPSPSMGQGGIGLPMGAPGATSQRATTPKPDSLIYISDEGTSDVYVYSLSKGTLVATLAGFSEPRGICLDKAGDVWITNAGASDLLEYAPGGTEPIASLNDPGEYPVDCSVETTTGDLGVANIISAKYGSGSLSLYNAPATSRQSSGPLITRLTTLMTPQATYSSRVRVTSGLFNSANSLADRKPSRT